jgi:hypothetical protein
MTALRKFHHADGRSGREPRRAASPCQHERGPRRPAAARLDSRAPAARPWALVRALRAGTEVLLALWAAVALAFFAAVALALLL